MKTYLEYLSESVSEVKLKEMLDKQLDKIDRIMFKNDYAHDKDYKEVTDFGTDRIMSWIDEDREEIAVYYSYNLKLRNGRVEGSKTVPFIPYIVMNRNGKLAKILYDCRVVNDLRAMFSKTKGTVNQTNLATIRAYMKGNANSPADSAIIDEYIGQRQDIIKAASGW